MSLTTKYILDKDGSHFLVKTYSEINNTTVKLIPSRYGNWTEKGRKDCKWVLRCNGNGVTITNTHLNLKLDYSQVSDLYKLLHEYNKASSVKVWDKYVTFPKLKK